MLASADPSRHRAETAELHRRAVERTILAMDGHLYEELSLKDMAAVGIMSPFHFNRVFRHVTGVPPVRFLSARRLEMAKRLLITTDQRITDICFEVGYNSLGTFTRRFTELVGTPPKQFRRLPQQISHYLEHLESAAPPEPPPHAPGVTRAFEGRLLAPEGFRGRIFVGLFPTAIPQGMPVACRALDGPGEFRLEGVPEGRYFLFALAMPSSARPTDYVLYEGALRGGGPDHRVQVRQDRVVGPGPLSLRPALPIDPPVLMTLPALLQPRTQAAAPRAFTMSTPARRPASSSTTLETLL
jgi:AraC family transcriptional regulator